MDDMKIDHNKGVTEMCAKHQYFLPIYLPPYSLDFNPIEKLFSNFKYQLHWHQLLTFSKSQFTINGLFLMFLPRLMPLHCWNQNSKFWIVFYTHKYELLILDLISLTICGCFIALREPQFTKNALFVPFYSLMEHLNFWNQNSRWWIRFSIYKY